jgi:hypothetical protein
MPEDAQSLFNELLELEAEKKQLVTAWLPRRREKQKLYRASVPKKLSSLQL